MELGSMNAGLVKAILHNMLCLGVMFIVGLILGYIITNTFLYIVIMALVVVTAYVIIYVILYFGMLRGRI